MNTPPGPNEAANVPRHEASPTSLRTLAGLFLRLGTTAFGGPAAHIAMMRDEVVVRRGWLTDAGFLDLVAAANLIPGPNSTELAIHIGYARRGMVGLLVAGVCFILPAMLITGGLGWAAVTWGAAPALGWLLVGVKPVMVAIVLQALWGLVPKAAPSWRLRLLGIAGVVAAVVGVHELLILGCAGVVAVVTAGRRRPSAPSTTLMTSPSSSLLAAVAAGVGVTTTAVAAPVTLPALFGVFAKAGAVLFGSGYVLLAFLRNDLVERLGWLTEAQLLDAVAVGQVTPGPVFTTATFIGYLLQGPAGALVATAGIFAPAFFFVAISGPLVPRLRASAGASAFLDGLQVASLALMATVVFQLAQVAIVSVVTGTVAVVAAAILVRWRVNATWLIGAGAVVGVALHVLQ